MAVAVTAKTVIGSAITGTSNDTVTTDTGYMIMGKGIGAVITGLGDGFAAIDPGNVTKS